MSVDKIKDQILNEVTQQASAILKDAEDEKQVILSEAEKDIERLKLNVLEKGKTDIETDIKRQLARANVEAKMKVLSAKEQGINEAVALGLDQLAQTFSSSGEALQKLLVDGGIALEGGDLLITVRKSAASKINKEAIEKAISGSTGVKTTIKVETDDSITKIGGGTVKKGNITVYNTAEAILDRKFRDIRLKVAETLFNKT
ncbi:MAG: V-type ATP synthase subunit E [Candidatus Odinarchaeota archaeon]